MPTIIAFDCSLSMSRFISSKVPGQTSEVQISLKSLGHKLITEIIKYLEQHVKLEYIALIAFAANSEVLCHFTRDHEALRRSLEKV